MNNTVQLITYADRIAGKGISELHQLLNTQLNGIFSGVHVLPYFYPIDGSDAGFDPIDHTQVDQRLGQWADIQRLGRDFDVMSDLIVNHMSAQSAEFRDVLNNGRSSVYWDLFLTQDKVFPNGITAQEQAAIIQPKVEGCFTPYQLADGETVNFWTTFTSNQIDIDVTTQAGKDYINRVLTTFAQNNVKLVRLDAAGFAIKRAGTSCFMLDETYDFIDSLSDQVNALGMESLVEVHSHYKTQIEIAKKVNLVYDFALPALVLHTLYQRDFSALSYWLDIAPQNCITVLDTHDGIGVEDVSKAGELSGLLSDAQVQNLVSQIAINSRGNSLKASGSAAGNVDIHQVNCSYYDALAGDDLQYLIARAIQFFSPGVPQVYYGGLFALENDMALLQKSNVGRDINRSYLTPANVETHLKKPVVGALIELIKLRNDHDSFNGEFSLASSQQQCNLMWHSGDNQISLLVDLASMTAEITLNTAGKSRIIDLKALLAQHAS